MENKAPEMEVISASSLELIQRAEVDMQIATAKRYPRPGPSIIKKKMLDFATLDEETAESCFYSVPRDGKTIQGPSVRLAEIAVSCYGNLRAASRVIANDGRILTSQAACHDLENNVLISVEVQRRITNKQGKTYSDDMQVTAGNAANSIAFRNAVFKVIPGSLYKPVYEAARLVAVGDASTLSTKRLKVVKRLNGMEITTDRILARLGRAAIEDITLEDLEILIGAGTAIRDGDTTVDEAFPPIGQNGPVKVDVKNETPEQREARQEENIRKQGEESPEPPIQTQPQTAEPPVAATNPTGPPWSDRNVMLAAFHEKQPVLGVDLFFRILGDNGIEGDDEMKLNADNVVKAFGEIERAIQDAKPVPPAAPKWGRRQR